THWVPPPPASQAVPSSPSTARLGLDPGAIDDTLEIGRPNARSPDEATGVAVGGIEVAVGADVAVAGIEVAAAVADLVAVAVAGSGVRVGVRVAVGVADGAAGVGVGVV